MNSTTFEHLKLKADSYNLLTPFFNDELSVDENVQLMLVVLYPELDEKTFDVLFRLCQEFYLDENDVRKPSNRIIAATAVWLSGVLCFDYIVDRALQEDIAVVTKVSTASMRNAKKKLLEQRGDICFYNVSDYDSKSTTPL